MNVNIIFSKTKDRRYFPKFLFKGCYALYWYETHSIELFTKRPKSTIKALIHEEIHQLLHELGLYKASMDYDNIAPDLEKWIFSI